MGLCLTSFPFKLIRCLKDNALARIVMKILFACKKIVMESWNKLLIKNRQSCEKRFSLKL